MRTIRQILHEYGITVSAMHNTRYFRPELAFEALATPYNCPKSIKKAIIDVYGGNWIEEFWTPGYDKKFPGVKEYAKKMLQSEKDVV